MTVKEMHNLVEVRLQKIASNQYRTFEGEELDMMLNQAQDIYVKEKFTNRYVNPNDKAYGVSQKRLDDLRALVTSNYAQRAITPIQGSAFTGHLYEDSNYNPCFVALPQDYMFLISDRSTVKHIGDTACKTIGTRLIDNDPTLQEYVTVLPFVANVSDICVNGVIDFKIVFKNALRSNNTYADVTLFDYGWFNTSTGYNPVKGLSEESDKYHIINTVLEFLNRSNAVSELVNFSSGFVAGSHIPDGYQMLEGKNSNANYFNVYWENYKDMYYPNSFIIVSKNRREVSTQSFNTLLSTVTGTIGTAIPAWVPDSFYNSTAPRDYVVNNDGQPGNETYSLTGNAGITVEIQGTSAKTVTSNRFRQISYIRRVIIGDDALDPYNQNGGNVVITNYQAPNKAVLPENLYRLQSQFATKASVNYPISCVKGAYLFGYTDGTFTIESITLDYIRKPRRMSLAFSQNCELAEHTHEEICMKAVELIQKSISDPKWQITEKDNIQNR